MINPRVQQELRSRLWHSQRQWRVAANTTDIINAEDYAGGFSVSAGGSIGIQTATASAMKFSFYGTTQRGR